MKKFSLSHHSVKNKLLVAFSLMFIIPALVFVYLISLSYNSDVLIQWNYLSLLCLLSILLAWLGFLLAKGFSDELVDMSIQARLITDGDLNTHIKAKTNDELSDIANSINYFTKRLKDDISQIKDYSQRTTEINDDIQQKMKMLEGLFDIVDRASAGEDIDRAGKMFVGKLAGFYDTGSAAIFKRDKETFLLCYGKSFEHAHKQISFNDEILSQTFVSGRPFIVDSTTANPLEKKEIIKRFNINNAIFLPVAKDNKTEYLIVSGNNLPNFSYTNEDVEILKLYAKQLSLWGK